MTIKVKNKIASGASKKGYFFKGLKGIKMPFRPANPVSAP